MGGDEQGSKKQKSDNDADNVATDDKNSGDDIKRDTEEKLEKKKKKKEKEEKLESDKDQKKNKKKARIIDSDEDSDDDNTLDKNEDGKGTDADNAKDIKEKTEKEGRG